MTDRELMEKIQTLCSAFSGRIGISIKGCDQEFTFSYQEKELMSSASVVKMFILGTFLEQCQQGDNALDTMAVLKEEEKKGGSGVLQYMRQGMQLSLADTATFMIILSDNTATNMMIDAVGGTEPVKHHLRKLGILRSSVNRKITDDPQLVASCNFGDVCAEDLAKYLWMMRKGMILDSSYTRIFFEIMNKQFYKDLFTRNMPLYDYYEDQIGQTVSVCSKTGFMEGIRTDAGLIHLPDGREYVYGITANDCRDLSFAPDNEAGLLFAKIGELFYQYVKDTKEAEK